MDDLISKLSEIRYDYNCFDEDEEPYYRALSETIKILSQREDGDTISRRQAIEAFQKELCREREYAIGFSGIERILNALPSVEPRKGKWVKENVVLTSNPPQYQWHCSECGGTRYGFSAEILTDFCPNCGAVMSEGEEYERSD